MPARSVLRNEMKEWNGRKRTEDSQYLGDDGEAIGEVGEYLGDDGDI